MAHQWFGNCLTPLTWADVWLSEGFAVYSEAVFTEDFYNYDAMLDYVHSSIQGYYLGWSGGQNYTIYDPAYNNYFSPPSYEKAASVLHMLRSRVGSDMFFEILQTYFQQYHNSNVVTEEFKQVCEDVSGQDLEQFFAQWIYGSGVPSYDYTWFLDKESNPPSLKTFVKSSSTSGTDFYLKIPVEIQYTGDVNIQHAEGSPVGQFTEIDLVEGDIIGVQVDPESWILNRGADEHIPEISNAYSADGQVQVTWSPFWNEVAVAGYNVYRSLDENDGYIKVNNELIIDYSFFDSNVENGTTYFYRITAVLEGEYESSFSSTVEAMPFGFPFDQGILVVDETMDGAGIPGNPNDEQVDEFYDNVIDREVTVYDYNELGVPTLQYLANFSTVIWHDDDMSQNFINNNLESLGSYLLSGGNLIISGWKTANEIQDYFIADFLGSEAQLTNGFEFTAALSDDYTDLYLDVDKLSQAFGGTLPFICTGNGIYQFHAEGGSANEGEACAVKNLDQVDFVFLGFPLYYFQEQGVGALINQLLEEMGESDVDEAIIPDNILTCKAVPNPFNPVTSIYFNIPEDSNVTLDIYNLRGQRIRHLINGVFDEGEHIGQWNGTDDNGKAVATGIYYYVLEAGGSSISRKLLLLK